MAGSMENEMIKCKVTSVGHNSFRLSNDNAVVTITVNELAGDVDFLAVSLVTGRKKKSSFIFPENDEDYLELTSDLSLACEKALGK